MADEAPAAPAEEVVEGEPKKKGPLVKIILIVVAVLLLIGLSVGGTLLATGFFNKKPKEAVDAQLDKLEGHGDGHAPAGDGHAPAGDGHGAPAADSHGKPAADSHGKPAAEPEPTENIAAARSVRP
jgi:flagellar basal body-associated protein FliL